MNFQVWLFYALFPSSLALLIPKRGTIFPSKRVYEEGSLLNLTCILKEPNTDITLAMYNKDINNSTIILPTRQLGPDRVQFSTSNVQLNQTGLYSCVKKRNLSDVFALKYIFVGRKPGKVNITCDLIAMRSFTCCFYPGQKGLKAMTSLQQNMFRFSFALKASFNDRPFKECLTDPEKKRYLTDTCCEWGPEQLIGSHVEIKVNASNVLGSTISTQSYYFLDIDRPEAPDLTGASDTNNVYLNWTMGSHPTSDFIFRLNCSSGEPTPFELVKTPSGVGNDTLSSLRPYTTVLCELRAKDKDGHGRWSHPVWRNITTEEAIPEHSPDVGPGIILYHEKNQHGNRRLSALFEPLPRRAWNGRKLHYLVRCPEAKLGAPSTQSVPSTASDVACEDVPNTGDVIEVTACNALGCTSPASQIVVPSEGNVSDSPTTWILMDPAGYYTVTFDPTCANNMKAVLVICHPSRPSLSDYNNNNHICESVEIVEFPANSDQLRIERMNGNRFVVICASNNSGEVLKKTFIKHKDWVQCGYSEFKSRLKTTSVSAPQCDPLKCSVEIEFSVPRCFYSPSSMIAFKIVATDVKDIIHEKNVTRGKPSVTIRVDIELQRKYVVYESQTLPGSNISTPWEKVGHVDTTAYWKLRSIILFVLLFISLAVIMGVIVIYCSCTKTGCKAIRKSKTMELDLEEEHQHDDTDLSVPLFTLRMENGIEDSPSEETPLCDNSAVTPVPVVDGDYTPRGNQVPRDEYDTLGRKTQSKPDEDMLREKPTVQNGDLEMQVTC